MERAHDYARSGYPEEAMRLASVAAELEKSGQAAYRKGEERPSDFIAWLQTSEGGRSAASNGGGTQWSNSDQAAATPTEAPETGITTAAAVQAQRAAEEVLRADRGSNRQTRGSADLRTATRTNMGVELPAFGTMRFQGNDKAERHPSTNSSQLTAPELSSAPTAEMAAAESNSDDRRLAALAGEEAPAPADGAQIELQSATTGGQSPKTLGSSARQRNPADADALAESEASELTPSRTSQLTLMGIIGLLSGVAGMAGLKWWHIQERRHFAAKH
jgi:hypothetical protein